MSKTSRILIAIIVTTAASFPVAVGAAGNLTEADKAHLIFMRSEEKLARDVYLTLAEMYPNQPVFLSIATNAEQTHTDRMLDMLNKFRIKDPELHIQSLFMYMFTHVSCKHCISLIYGIKGKGC